MADVFMRGIYLGLSLCLLVIALAWPVAVEHEDATLYQRRER